MKNNTRESSVEKNREMRRKRTMRYFIEAASEILNEEGLDKVTTRRVAAKAGYNSATIYNYFGNFDRLVAFAAIKGLEDYAIDLSRKIDESMGPIEKYVNMWACYFTHFQKSPVVFNLLFEEFKHNPLAFLNEYYDIFPEEKQELPSGVSEVFFEKDYDLRNKILLYRSDIDKFNNEQNASAIVDMVQFIFEGFMEASKEDPKKYNLDLFIKYLKQIIISYSPDHKEEIEAITY